MAVMQKIIPTLGRTERQPTVSFFPPEVRKQTTFVCPAAEALQLSLEYPDIPIVEQPDHIRGIAQTRQWIVQTWWKAGYDKIIMLDDHLTFSTRIWPDSAVNRKLRQIWGEELIPEFARIEQKLGPECPHAGFGPRQGNCWQDAGWQSPGKMVYALGYYLPIVSRYRFDILELREDYCMTLQLLLDGHPNGVYHTTVVNQVTNAPGGCSTYRTKEMSDAEARRLIDWQPDYVSPKPDTGTPPRMEVRISWAEALRDGQRKRAAAERQQRSNKQVVI